MDRIKEVCGISVLGIGALCFLFWGFFLFSMFLALGTAANESWGDFIPFVFKFIRHSPVFAIASVLCAIVFIAKMDKIL